MNDHPAIIEQTMNIRRAHPILQAQTKLKLSLFFVVCVSFTFPCYELFGQTCKQLLSSWYLSPEFNSYSKGQKALVQPEFYPDKEQVKSLINQEYKGLFFVDSEPIYPSYLVGDFNGDGVKDIVVLCRPKEGIDPNDKSRPFFWLNSADTGGKPPTKAAKNRRRKTNYSHYQFTLGDLSRYQDGRLPVLVIIHGAEGRGWRNSQQYQRFVVLDGIDLDVDRMRLYRGKLKAAAIGDTGVYLPPNLVGDGILFTYPGQGSIVYWDKDGYYSYPFESSEIASAVTGVSSQNRLSHLKKWVNKYPIDNSGATPKNFFKLPEIDQHLYWLLGATDYKRLLSDFEVATPIIIVDDFLVTTGSASKPDAEGYTETALVAVRLRDPAGLGMICVGFSEKLGDKLTGETEWDCTSGDYLRSSETLLPVEIRAIVDAEAAREMNYPMDKFISRASDSQSPKRSENIEYLAIHKVKAEYPQRAQSMAVSGKVRVRVEVSEEGKVLNAEVISGHDMLRESALQAARQWTFFPAMRDGVSVKMRGIIEFHFVLK